jgi:hypothetical protein
MPVIKLDAKRAGARRPRRAPVTIGGLGQSAEELRLQSIGGTTGAEPDDSNILQLPDTVIIGNTPPAQPSSSINFNGLWTLLIAGAVVLFIFLAD